MKTYLIGFILFVLGIILPQSLLYFKVIFFLIGGFITFIGIYNLLNGNKDSN